MSEAYLATAERKAAVLARLDEALAADRVLIDTGVWDAPNGSPAAVVAQDADLRSFEAFTGIPAAVGGLVDLLALYLSNTPEQRNAFLIRFFTATRPGARLDLAAAQFLVAMHNDPAMARAAKADPDVVILLDRSRGTQADVAEEREVPRAVWSALRTDAMDLAETRSGKVSGVLDFIERTAWPLARSRSALSDGMATLLQLASSFAVEDSGWSAADQQKIDEAFQAIQAEALARGEENPNYPALLSAREPVLEARFRAQIELQGRSVGELAKTWADRLANLAETF